MTTETKRKISEALRGNKNSLGFRHTPDARRRIGEAAKKRTKKYGPESPAWKGGISRAEANRRWRAKNRELSTFWSCQRYFLKRGLGEYSLEEWQQLKEKYGFTCLCCRKKEPEVKLTQDHVVPLTKGGTNTIDNIQPLCGPCNSRKYTKTKDYRELFTEEGELSPVSVSSNTQAGFAAQ